MLFIDNIGRPDLFKEKEKEKEKVTEEFANMLHDTLHQKKFKNLQELFGLKKGEFTKQMVSSIMMQTLFTPTKL
jgi:hypothetical protein